MHLGESVWLDTVAQHELCKVEINPDHVSFLLPTHKSDRQLVQATGTEDCPVRITNKYIDSWDHLFPAHPNGSIPTPQWFI
jgi:hypothetical protein